MTDIENSQSYERIFNLLRIGVPKLFEAAHYIEKSQRIIPHPVFLESRDVLSHLRDISQAPTDKDVFDKNIVEIEEHLRRGIVETYQEHYEYLSSNAYRTYGKYLQSFIRFEMLLGLRDKHKIAHEKIKSTIRTAQDLWMEARNLKNNELNSQEFALAISKFKEASDLIVSIEDDVESIYNNFYKRSIITSFITVFSISLLILVGIKL